MALRGALRKKPQKSLEQLRRENARLEKQLSEEEERRRLKKKQRELRTRRARELAKKTGRGLGAFGDVGAELLGVD